MPPDLPNDQELSLKKRARRRLVGAVALVLLMIIVLPMILQDRAALVQQEAIKISMPESNSPESNSNAKAELSITDSTESVVVPDVAQADAQTTEIDPVVNVKPNSDSIVDKTSEKNNELIKKESQVKKEAQAKIKAEEKAKQLKALKSKEATIKTSEVKVAEVKPSPTTSSSFIVQIGVYSDLANVKQLQEKSKQAGYKSNIETIKTPKGDKYRLRTSSFTSRQNAADALTKLQAVGLPGMVMTNE
jgi:DedD protein